MNCCKFFQSKHGKLWPRKGESCFLSMNDIFTKMLRKVMREETATVLVIHNSIK